MVRKSKKGIVGKSTIPGTGHEMPGPGLDFVDNKLTSSREIEEAEARAREEEGLDE